MKKIGLISVLVVLAGLAWYAIAGARTGSTDADTETVAKADTQH